MAPKKKKKKPGAKGAKRPSDRWTLEDFIASVEATMRGQESANPHLAKLHERLSPEFKEITKLIFQYAQASDQQIEEKIEDTILAYGKKALLPLLEFIRLLKKKEPFEAT